MISSDQDFDQSLTTPVAAQAVEESRGCPFDIQRPTLAAPVVSSSKIDRRAIITTKVRSVACCGQEDQTCKPFEIESREDERSKGSKE